MRQLEGGWLSNTSLERSKQRLQRLPYVKKVDFETTPVPARRTWSTWTSRSRRARARSSAAASATRRSQSFILNGSYADSNFMGTGKRVAVELNSRRATARSTASRTPTRTPRRQPVAHVLAELSRRHAVRVRVVGLRLEDPELPASTYGYPITEFQYLRFGVSLQQLAAADQLPAAARCRRSTGCSSNGNSVLAAGAR